MSDVYKMLQVSQQCSSRTGVTKVRISLEAPHLFDRVHATVVCDFGVHFVDFISSLQGRTKVRQKVAAHQFFMGVT